MHERALDRRTRGGQLDLDVDQGRTQEAGETVFSGTVAAVVCNRAPDFMVFRVETDGTGEVVSVAARGCPEVSRGMRVKVGGRWTTGKYGRQIEAAWVAPELTSQAIVAAGFLQTRVRGIGPLRAASLVAEHGDRLPDLLRDKRALCRTRGIGPVLAAEIVKAWTAISPQDMADLELAGLGITEGARRALLARFGSGAADAVRKNPWVAAKCKGLGIADADRLAMQLGVANSCPERAQAVVVYALDHAARDVGSTRVDGQALYAAAAAKGVDHDRTDGAVSALVDEGEIVIHDTDEVSPSWLDRCEQGIARHLRRLARTWRPAASVEVPSEEGFVPTAGQTDAVLRVQRDGVMVLTGGPGTGKTTITRLVYLALQRSMQVVCCSPTGRASERLREATGKESSTIHRLLGWHGGESWAANRQSPLARAAYIVDEFSMVDVALFWRLLEAIPDGSALLLVGDRDQLPSVGPGAVLRDLVDAQAVPVCVLTRIHRQAEGNPVIAGCHAVLRGAVPQTGRSEQGELLVVTRNQDRTPVETPEDVAAAALRAVEWIRSKGHGMRDVQVLSAGKRSEAGTQAMNRRLRKLWLGASEEPRLVEQTLVMQLVNDYDRGLWNGTQGVVESLAAGEDGSFESGVVVWDGPGRMEMAGHELEARRVQECLDATVHKCVHPDTLVESTQGLLPHRLLARAGGTVAGPDGPREYDSFYDWADGELLEVVTRDGYRLRATPDHGVDVWSEEASGFVRVEAKDIRAGAVLRLRMGVTCDPACGPVLSPPPVPDVRARRHRFPREVTGDLAEFLGLMVADGTVFDRGFRLAKRHRDVRDRFAFLCDDLFGVRPRLYEFNHAFAAEVSSTEVVSWLRRLGGMEPEAKAVPECVLRSPAAVHARFLRGLFEDGSVHLRGGRLDHIEWSSVYPELRQAVRTMLLRLGIISGCVSGRPDRVCVYGVNAQRFRQQVGFVSAFKNIRLAMPAGRETRYWLPLSRSEAAAVSRAFVSIGVMGVSTGQNIRRLRRISRHAAEQVLATMELVGEEPTAEELLLRDRLGWHYSEVREVIRTTGPSMCIGVPDGHRFLQNGISAWNSQGSQWPWVVVLVHLSMGYPLLVREVVYTAISRAQVGAVLIGPFKSLAIAVGKSTARDRQTGLREYVRSEMARPDSDPLDSVKENEAEDQEDEDEDEDGREE